MKILFILENYMPHIGGVEIVFKNLSEGLVKLGHDVSIVTHRIKKTKKFELINGVKVYRVNCFHSRYWFTFLSLFKSWKLAKKVDLIHTTTFNGAFPAWLIAKILKKPVIITVHEVWVGQWTKLTEMNHFKALLHNFLEKLIYLLNFDKYIGVSQSTQKQLWEVGIEKNKTSYIYNGVDYEHWNPNKYNGAKIRKNLRLENNFVYLFTGRPGVSKGLEYLIKAVPLISQKIPCAKLLIILSKDKAYEKRYQSILSLINKLEIDNKVIIHDPISYSELPNYVKAADCVVVPSLSEGFGYAAAEACAMGVPVVASDTTSLPEVISGKFLLIKSKDEKSIAKGILKVYNHKFNVTLLKKFTKNEAVKKYLEEYLRLI